jgi:hypothetical protein
MIMRIRVKEAEDKHFRLFIPLFLVWLLLLPLLLLAAPFILIAAVVTWKQGYGRMLLGIFPMLISVIGALSGLHIQVESPENQTFISIR